MSEKDEEVRIWDEWGQEQDVASAEKWDSWDLCMKAPGFPKGLVHFLKDSERGCGFPAPSLIQAYAWPALVTGKDFIGVAKTGSGKTLAFLLPSFMWLKKNRKGSDPVDTTVGPAILALTPTRELCYQIYSDTEKFGTPVKITAACAYGGAPKWEQEQKFRDNPDVLIATPGRLADFLRSRVVSLEQCKFFIMDEADRMLDMGFEKEVKEILDWMPQEKQISMFTATWPKEVRALADNYIKKPIQVQCGSLELKANEDVTQHFEVLSGDAEKKAALEKILEGASGAVLVFCNSKKKVRDLTWELHPKAVELHGDLKQKERDEAMQKFRNGDVSVLIATDVASRGLDMRTVSVVVNYDAPNSCKEDYVHRIGRTGRAGDKGDAYTFLSEWGDEQKAADILNMMERGSQKPPDVLRNLAKGHAASSGGDDWLKEEKGDDGNWWEKDSSEEKRVHPSDKSGKAYTYAEFVEFEKGDDKKGRKLWDESKPVEDEKAKKGSEEKRVHPADKTKTAYTYEEFLAFEPKKGQKMWDESTPVETPKEEDNKADDDKWWEKKDEKAPVSDDPAEQFADQPEEKEEAANEDAAMEENSESGVKRPLEDDESAPAAKAAKTEGDDVDLDKVVEQLKDGSGSKLTNVQIKAYLSSKSLSTQGLKAELLERATTAANEPDNES